jgi:hypothetical protein
MMETPPLSPAESEALVARLKMDGYVLLPELIPRPLVERMRERFDALLAERQAAHPSNRGPNRYQMVLPFEPPFAEPALYENPLVLQILEGLMGPDLICTYFASDTPLPGSEHQRVHADTRLLFPETSLSLPAYGAVLNVPLVDVTEENGPLELWPGGTHYMPGRLDMAELAPGMVSVRLKMKAGAGLLRDLRVWHRGTPNRGARSRPNLALVYTRPWYRFEQPPFTLPRATYEALSDRARAMLRHNRIVE